MRRLLLTVALATALPLAVPAQDAEAERDRGFLTALIEDNLSSPGLSVRIDGFQGALTSRATLDVLTVSDDQGVWLRLEDVTLDWNRSALLRGRLEVEELTAALISVDRTPLPAEGRDALPDAGASGFSLPDLPVSVNIDAVRANRIELGEALLGEAVALSLQASARLADGSGAATIAAQRLDGPGGTFAIDVAYDAGTTELSVEVAVSEVEGGIAARLLQLPGAPAIDLTVQGDGPLDDFTADVAVASGGQERLAGQVTLRGVPDGRRFDVDIGGDLTALLAPRYRDFFGDDVGLRVAGTQSPDGTVLDTLDVTTRALSLQGSAAIGPDGWPTALDVQGQLAGADGAPVLLPTATAINIGSATFSLQYDIAVGPDVSLALLAQGFDHPAVRAGEARVEVRGQILRDGGAVTRATADISAALDALEFTDPALQQAVGQRVTLDTDLGWERGGPVRLSDLSLSGQDYGIDGSASWALDGADLPLGIDVTATVARIARFSDLAGRDLAGSIEARLSGAAAPLSGAFDMSVDGRATDLATGIAQLDPLLDGATDLDVAARRDVTGTYLDRLNLTNEAITVTGQATLLAEDALARTDGATSTAALSLTLADGAAIDPRLAGEITAEVDAAQNAAGEWTGDARIAAPQGITAQASGVLTGPSADVSFKASIPRIAAFVDGIPGGLTASGRAFASDGAWSVDAAADGPWDVTATVKGQVTGDRPGIAFTASLPDLTDPVPALDAVPALAGPMQLDGLLTRGGDAWVTDATLTAPQGITARLSGPVTGPAPRLEVAATVPRLQAFVPAVEGTLSLNATLARDAGDWTVDARATGPYGARATAQTVLGDDPLAIDVTLAVPRLADLAPGLPGGTDVSGTVVLAEGGPRVDLSGSGPYASTLTVSATLADSGPEVTASIRVPDATVIAPQLRGPLVVDAQAQQTDGVWTADIDASGPLGSSLAVQGTVAGGPVDVTVDLTVPDVAPLLPDLRGPLRVDGTVTQSGGNYRLALDLDGPAGTDATVAGTVTPAGRLDLSVRGSAPLGLANAALAPQRISGTAAFDLTVSGPLSLDSISGTVRTTDAALSLPALRNGLDPLSATITLSGGRAQMQANATLNTGGDISVSGPINLSAPFDADLRAQFGVMLVDPSLYTVDIAGDVSLTGPLAGGAVLSGRLTVEDAEILVPSSGLTAIGDLPPIEHLRTPRPVQRTLERAGQDAAAQQTAAEPRGPGYRLDLQVSAPSRIFVRGRGLDAELGGQLRVTGSTRVPVTAGGFELIRGRLDILQQRFALDEGQISFQGSLVPFIRLVAVTETDALTASIIVEGPANAIDVTFASTPDVPQEEILAQIFFGRDLSQLSPLQALQLANSVAVLAGRGSTGLLERLRGNAGLDDLDITTDAEGNTAVRAGKYLSDNLYTDVQVGSDGNASISLNLDVTPNLTVRGATGADGNSTLGIFYERDY